MLTETPEVATHLLENWCLSYSHRQFLRKTSLDELPQLVVNSFTGDMSFVGPRPALRNQDDLIELRTSKGVHSLVPGLAGWAQINGRDELPIPEEVNLDVGIWKVTLLSSTSDHFRNEAAAQRF